MSDDDGDITEAFTMLKDLAGSRDITRMAYIVSGKSYTLMNLNEVRNYSAKDSYMKNVLNVLTECIEDEFVFADISRCATPFKLRSALFATA